MNLEIFHNNICSISENFDDLSVFLKDLEFRQFNRLYILILTETRTFLEVYVYKMEWYITIYNYIQLNQNDGIVIFLTTHFHISHKLFTLSRRAN